MILTPELFAKTEASVASDCKDLPENTGISVALWRLRSLIEGYRYALNYGYQPGAPIEKEERETNP